MSSRLAKVAILVASLLLGFAAAEALLRIIDYEYRPMRIAAGENGDSRSFHLFNDEHFVYDTELIWKPKPGFDPFNSLGFRGEEVDPAAPGLRLATVGDSNTLGWSGEIGANWPGALSDLLESISLEAEVVNAGVWGYSSHQGVPRTRQVLELQPDIVLVSFGSNDAHWVTHSDDEYNGGLFGGRGFEVAARNLRLGQLFFAVRDGRRSPGLTTVRRVSLDDYRGNLRTMIADSRAADAIPVLLTRPYYGPVVDESKWKYSGAEYNRATAEVAESEGVLLIDLFTFFKERDSFFADESHFTEAGHQAAAAIIFEHLRPLLRLRAAELP